MHEEEIIRIEAYLSGNMAPDEKQRFESEMAAHPEMHKLFLQHKYFLDGIEGMKMQAFQKSLDVNQPGVRHRRSPLFLVIAIVFLVLAVVFYFTTKQKPEENLARAYYAAPMAELQRTDQDPQDSLYRIAMEAFDHKAWKKAQETFDRIDQNHPLQEQIQYYKAHTLIGSGEYSAATTLFEMVANRRGQYLQQAEWNAVLAQLFDNTNNTAIIETVNAIANNPDHFYREKARQLLEKLREE